MAFNTNPANNGNNGNSPSNDSWKCQAFLNVYMEKKDGSRSKIGAMQLKDTQKFQGALIKRLSVEDKDAAIADMLPYLRYDFQLVNDPNAPAVELPF